MPQYAGRSSQHQTPPPLIQMRQQLAELCRQYLLSPLRHTRILRPQPPHQIKELLIDSSLLPPGKGKSGDQQRLYHRKHAERRGMHPVELR
jgi:hypothetical protein